MMLLNLRNLYKLLVQRDYPCYSNGILTRNPNRNRTLVGFWREILTISLPEDADLEIFRTEAGRSRSLSKLLAGTEPRGFRAKWYETLGKKLSIDTVTSLTFSFYSLLMDQQADPGALNSKLTTFITDKCCSSNSVRVGSSQ